MKSRKYKLASSLICADFLHLEKDVDLLTKSNIDYIHFDVMDGVFVPRYGLFPEILQQVRKISAVPMDFHMMVKDAEPYIQAFKDYGANKKDIFVVHVETTHHLDRVIRRIKESGMKAGVALNPSTPLESIRYVLDDVDLVMLMAINPGVVGHRLIPYVIQKIQDLKGMTKNRDNLLIEVDGGVNFESAPKMLESGANMLVCGTQTIFRPHEGTITQKVKELRKVLDAVVF